MKKPKTPKGGGLVSVHSKPPPGGHKHHHQQKAHHHQHKHHQAKHVHPVKQHHHPHPHHHRKPPKKPVKRKLSLGDISCCAAEALAASLRLLGVPVGDEEVLALYWRTAAHADAGASISETLEAAQRFGLAGIRPVSFAYENRRDFMPEDMPGLILGVTLPGAPHALAAAPDGTWWSWGEPYCAACSAAAVVIEEAWTVEWAA